MGHAPEYVLEKNGKAIAFAVLTGRDIENAIRKTSMEIWGGDTHAVITIEKSCLAAKEGVVETKYRYGVSNRDAVSVVLCEKGKIWRHRAFARDATFCNVFVVLEHDNAFAITQFRVNYDKMTLTERDRIEEFAGIVAEVLLKYLPQATRE